MRDVTPVAAADVDSRQMAGVPAGASGSSNISQVVLALQNRPRGFVVVDLGSKAKTEWLSSRVYLLAYLIALIDPAIVMVLVENSGGVRHKYVGVACPDDVRWALARRYAWLASQLILYFLANVRGVAPAADAPKERLQDWVNFAGGEAEYAAWLPAGRLERRLGAALGRASVVIPPNHNLNDLGPAVLKQ